MHVLGESISREGNRDLSTGCLTARRFKSQVDMLDGVNRKTDYLRGGTFSLRIMSLGGL